METRTLITIGVVGVGGYFAWRWWKGRAVVDAQNTAGDSIAGREASGMTEAAARATVWGSSIARRLLPPVLGMPKPLATLPSPTAAPSAVVRQTNATYPGVQRQVLGAVLAPLPVSPSPDNFRFTSTGILGVTGTAPSGDQPSPGDPMPFSFLQTRGVGGFGGQ